MGHTVEDLMFLFGHKKKGERENDSGKFGRIRTRAQNDWYEGKDAKDNPYDKEMRPLEHEEWYNTWRQMNINC